MRAQTRHHTQKHRHGLHHRHNKHYLKTYLPYLPVIVAIILSVFISNLRPAKSHTLAYATEMSINSLLEETNGQRSSNGQASLQINQRLNSAAQAKANDMIARNYWSHNTPDGQEPWVFFENAGYSYQKAGENLAYGFTTSNDTVTGWMNSPSHRANMLDGAFSEVGFGFANGNSYNNSGPETVVVAEYGKPQTLGATNQTSSPQPVANPQAQTPASSSLSPTTPNQTITQPPPAPHEKTISPSTRPINTDFPIITGTEGLQPLSRIQALTGGGTPWTLFAAVSLCGIAALLLLIKHSFALRHVLINSEKMVLRQLHHPLFDSILLAIIILGFTLSRTVGFIG